MKLSLNDVVVLLVLRKGPDYAWNIARSLPEVIAPESDTVYKSLLKMEKYGLLRSELESDFARAQNRRSQRRYYSLTNYGSRTLQKKLAALKKLLKD